MAWRMACTDVSDGVTGVVALRGLTMKVEPPQIGVWCTVGSGVVTVLGEQCAQACGKATVSCPHPMGERGNQEAHCPGMARIWFPGSCIQLKNHTDRLSARRGPSVWEGIANCRDLNRAQRANRIDWCVKWVMSSEQRMPQHCVCHNNIEHPDPQKISAWRPLVKGRIGDNVIYWKNHPDSIFV